MFDIGWSEMGLILMVALIVIGPKDLPRLAREIGKWTAKARSMAREFQRSFEDMAREAELQDIKSELEKVSRTDMRRQIENTLDPDGSIKRALQAPNLTETVSDTADADPEGPFDRFIEEDDEGRDAPASAARAPAAGSLKPMPPAAAIKAPAESAAPAAAAPVTVVENAAPDRPVIEKPTDEKPAAPAPTGPV